MRIHLLLKYDFLSYFFIYPLLVNRSRLRKKNIDIACHTRITDKLFECDIVMLDSKYFRQYWNNNSEYALSKIEEIREKSRKLIWSDTTDSTGTGDFQVLPYVDEYWKKQILKEKNLYERRFYNSRIYTDYYARKFNLWQEGVYTVDPADGRYLDRISCSWNIGLGPISENNKVANVKRFVPYRIKESGRYEYKVRAHPPGERRDRKISFRGSNEYSNNILSFQRNEIIRYLGRRGVECRPTRYSKYWSEMRTSKIGISPFGAGEICFRDFEIILSGAVLLKANMDHLHTYPELFETNVTYVPFKWDVSDLDERIESLLKEEDRMREISTKAQERYVYYLSEEGQAEFCKRLAGKLGMS